ncbi:glycine--tRNA ligase subunit beta [Sphingomonas ursincola]|uniref:glycine--tRNA ligase subunit beta n=1 Tax=Sphingomonas ursincola TaxID=56361 RepID=UPI0023578F78|nr:glycine--tRNA ligase subunit beta [Sphingomonas ursincola]MBY0619994.1 glycine--tRNA ligase subunit beta [Sphingomonas ursincola]
MTDFLLELLSEEIPARMQAKARADLEKLFTEQLAAAGLKAQSLQTFSTPRRLALIARGLPETTEAVSEELKGPPADAPDAAVEGFLRKAGLTRDALETRDVKGRATLFAVIAKPGRATADVLSDAIPAIVRAFPWPKSMRWGAASQTTESLRWVRPLQGIIALLGGYVVPCEVDGLVAGNTTVGHRFHHKGAVTVSGVEDYADALRAAHVIVDHEERARIIRDGAVKAAADAGFVLVEDEGLVVENAGLTEWPVPLLGRFDPAFLEVPPEVIQLTARVNQKYFVVQDASGALAPAFVCTANIAAHDGGQAIVAGNEKVLAARLSDARFFWELDQKKTLEQHAEKLKAIVFHEKLGTVADKVERVKKLALWLVDQDIIKPTDETPQGKTKLYNNVQTAAAYCKADLVTEMVGEFPELQGLMGGYYAAKEGLDPQVAAAIRDHYKPVGQGDAVPTDPVTVAVSLADKLDTLVGFFFYWMPPTGSKDPFALRRAALGSLQLELVSNLRFSLLSVADRVIDLIAQTSSLNRQGTQGVGRTLKTDPKLGQHDVQSFELLDFFADRLKVQQREAGVRHDLIDAVFALGGEDDLVRLLARVKALQGFVETGEGGNLLAGYKRAANILKKEMPSPLEGRGGSREAAEGEGKSPTFAQSPLPTLPPAPQASEAQRERAYELEPAEAALIAALDTAEPAADAAIAAEEFEGAMAALAALRAPIDAFFESVTVNDADEAKREARLNLLARFRAAVHRVADFSKIEG